MKMKGKKKRKSTRAIETLIIIDCATQRSIEK
jgi:hypothetical protein